MKEEMTTNTSMEEIIRKDNRKAGGKYVLILVLSGIVGLITGFLSGKVTLSISNLSETFDTFMTTNITTIGIVMPIILLVITAGMSIWCVAGIKYSKKHAFAYIEEDNEEALQKLEEKLSYNVWGTSGLLILQYLFFSAIVFADVNYSNENGHLSLLYMTVAFAIGMFVVLFLQQKLVDCIRLINPEKQGSVYDLRFDKKWEESCDEAEKMIIYKSAYRAYKVTSILCIVLWVIFTVWGLNTGEGFMTVVVILLIWSVLTCVYSYYGIKYSK